MKPMKLLTKRTVKVNKYATREEWLEGRLGKITGSRAGDITPKLRGSGKKIGFYELIAERLAIPREEGESAMDRGTRLEEDAIKAFTEETGLEVDASLVIWSRDEDDSIAISPDAVVIDKSWAVEAKCLSDAKHIEAYMTQTIPSEYEEQVDQYFVVNDDCEKVFMAFYNPNLSVKQFFYIEVNRDQDKVNAILAMERQVLEEVRQAVTDLSF